MQPASKYVLGMGALPQFVVLAAFLGVAAFFGHAAMQEAVEPLVVSGEVWADGELVRIALILAAIFMLVPGLFLLIKILGNGRSEKSVTLDSNRIVLANMNISGGEQAIAYHDIEKIRRYKMRGMPVIEIRGRDGTRFTLPSVLFADTDAFEGFYQELETHATRLNLSISA